MEIDFKKDMDLLEREIILKSVDLDDDISDFEIDIEEFHFEDKFIAISPRCIRCDLCVEECPTGAITSSSTLKRSRITEDCVKCEICAQTCPISCIYILDASANIESREEPLLNYSLKELKVPHRILRLEDFSFNRENCIGCGECTRFCPSKAISLKSKEFIESKENKSYDNYLEDGTYPYIEEKLCIGCGSCSNLCKQEVITINKYLGPIVQTKDLIIDNETCVGCFLCEEYCPVGAIKLNEEHKVELDASKCIRCNSCTDKCPVAALRLKDIDKLKKI